MTTTLEPLTDSTAQVHADSPAQVLENLAALVPRLRERAPQTEADRLVPQESMDDVIGAGMLRMFVPRVFGGMQATVREFLEATSTVAKGCPATAWCTAQSTWAALVIAQFPLEVQQAVWGDGPDVPTASTAIGMTAREVPGGYILSGGGPFASGSPYAKWFYLAATVVKDDGPPGLRFFVLPRRDVAVIDTWDTMAMRGTSSNTVKIDDAFVAENFSIDIADLREAAGPGTAHNLDPLYRIPWTATTPLIYLAMMLGATQQAYERMLSQVGGKVGMGGARLADSEVVQMDVGRISAVIDTAELVMNQAADRADAGTSYPPVERARMNRNAAHAVTMLMEAVDDVMGLSGTSGFATSSFVQQAWRDVHFAAAHQALGRRTLFARYGRMLLGLEDVPKPLLY